MGTPRNDIYFSLKKLIHTYSITTERFIYIYILSVIMVFLDRRFDVRITRQIWDKLHAIKAVSPDKYDSLGHVVRCAVIKLFNDEVLKNGATLSTRKKKKHTN